ncbi:MAG: transposase [Gammaproteobacteria bacterium RIFOXYA12_FULL_61_12]|nr:MAG: transposase [Gammaproteobacteria bacterium RIFOXYA12_FULL_61_12]OGT89752.1 MAG: transposase [Gammaproteobacteria bacterium RIFOXYD12_FULL_61_37]
MSELPVFTYQARLALNQEQEAALAAFADLHGRIERSLFAAMQARPEHNLKSGRERKELRNELKRTFCRRFKITTRQYNAIRSEVDGKIDAIKERRPDLIKEAGARLTKLKKTIAKLEKKAPGTNKLHQKKRRYATQVARLFDLKSDQKVRRIRICFGSKKLFRAQFSLEENGYPEGKDGLAAWREDWREARSRQFFVLGSKDEMAGNQTCSASLVDDGSFTLRLRLPDAHIRSKQDKYIALTCVRFAHGQEAIRGALSTSRIISSVTKKGEPSRKYDGTSISYRFLRDEKGWRVFVSVEAQPVETRTSRLSGAIGVDINGDHLAVAETDRFGNLIDTWRLDCVTYGKSEEQAKALIGDAAKAIAEKAIAAGKLVVIELLDFAKKKAELASVDPARARQLSSFAFSKTIGAIKSACFRAGVEVIEVNPAYTSVIGSVNYARRHGISVHQGAALAIARRGLGYSERPPRREASVPVRNGAHVTFALPVRTRAKHVWSYWASVKKKLTAAHAAHIRRGKPPPRSLSGSRAPPGCCR